MKNLEKEYKEAISHDTPDLWSRIEAGVDAYEASKKEVVSETPSEKPKDNIVKFDSKRFINIIGKISVAAVLFLVVAATFNLTRNTRKEAANFATETAQTTDYSSTAAEASEAVSEPLPIPNAEEAAEIISEPVVDEEPATIDNSYKDAELSLEEDALAEPSASQTEAKSDSAESAASPIIKESENVTAKTVAKLFDIGTIDAIRFLTDLNNLGLTDLRDLTIEETSVTDSTPYGFDAGDEPFSIASFTAGSNRDKYLLFYRTDSKSGMDILAVKANDESGDFLFTKLVEK